MKIALITLYGEGNYGNKLQNYAGVKILESLELHFKEKIEVETITGLTRQCQVSCKTKIKRLIKRVLINLGYKKYTTIFEIEKLIKEKQKVSFEFSKRYLNLKSYDQIHELKKFYDIFCVGSDQVWNTQWNRDEKDLMYYLLSFAEREKRITLSPSFGVDKVDKFLKEIYCKELSKFNLLSCREEAGARIIYDLTGKDCTVLIDPTMVLTQDDWNLIREESHLKLSKPYIFGYFLGDITLEYQDRIDEYKRLYDLEFVNIMDMHDPIIYTSSPAQFIDLLANAALVCTDSFHGSVFSILYHKPLVVFDRHDSDNNMSSRIDTLLSKFSLEDRKYDVLETTEVFNIHYENTDAILSVEREKVFDFLRKSIEINRNRQLNHERKSWRTN